MRKKCLGLFTFLVMSVAICVGTDCPGANNGYQTTCSCAGLHVMAFSCGNCPFGNCANCSNTFSVCGRDSNGACYVSATHLYCLEGALKKSPFESRSVLAQRVTVPLVLKGDQLEFPSAKKQ